METFEKLYVINPEMVSNKTMDTMVMCGSSNWDYYFTKTNGAHSDIFKNVAIKEFENIAKMQKFISKHKIIDFSTEHLKPCVLIKKQYL